MNIDFNNSVLITGCVRSGTTFLGRILSLNKNMIYLWEPFQAGLKEKNKNGVFDYWFEFLEENTTKKDDVFKWFNYYASINKNDILKLRTKNLQKIGYEYRNIRKKIIYNFRNKDYRFVFKDPIAVFSAEWIYKNIENLKVIIMIRNPVSIIESYKILNWDIRFIEIQKQKNLLKNINPNFIDIIKEYSINKKIDIIDKGILLWNIIYQKVIEYKKLYGNKWIFVKLEDLTNNSVKKIKEIHDYCGINFYEKIFNKDQSLWFLNSSKIKKGTNNILTEMEKEKIISETRDIATKFGYYL